MEVDNPDYNFLDATITHGEMKPTGITINYTAPSRLASHSDRELNIKLTFPIDNQLKEYIIRLIQAQPEDTAVFPKLYDNISTNQCKHGIDWGNSCGACGR